MGCASVSKPNVSPHSKSFLKQQNSIPFSFDRRTIYTMYINRWLQIFTNLSKRYAPISVAVATFKSMNKRDTGRIQNKNSIEVDGFQAICFNMQIIAFCIYVLLMKWRKQHGIITINKMTIRLFSNRSFCFLPSLFSCPFQFAYFMHSQHPHRASITFYFLLGHLIDLNFDAITGRSFLYFLDLFKYKRIKLIIIISTNHSLNGDWWCVLQ